MLESLRGASRGTGMRKQFYAIEFHDVSLAFEDRVVLDKISFVVRYGEAKIVMGGSGTGKSTLLRLALGLLKPDSGRISYRRRRHHRTPKSR